METNNHGHQTGVTPEAADPAPDAAEATAPPSATIKVAKTGPDVWSWLGGEDRSRFEQDFRAALSEVHDDFDVSRLQEVIDSWWAVAVNMANPDPDAEAAREKYESGDSSGLVEVPAEQPEK
ncbi:MULTISPECIES: DUF6247 family protein [unclassified Crossiella]|uniref:DUF6247 family protein n=1 Tax=unclassified Crossiella TaxID=2620835 RepID=UPI001FFE63EB|nr:MULTISPECIES: DUF6247 family protein [unclassified Crossiella]MCK2242303.1 DUF6247 family protein [Crossiella sp. S99.2]MCK2254666.1 DUF6247 family protein [Crossiella sp. S99.1]